MEKDSEITPKSRHLAFLADCVARWTRGKHEVRTAIPSLTLYRYESPTDPVSYMQAVTVCMVAQGSKRVMLEEEVYAFDPDQFLISSMELPVVAQITEASASKPYLGLTLALDLNAISELLVNEGLPEVACPPACRCMAVGKVSDGLRGAFERLVELLDTPDDIPILAPMILREICYRVLVSDQGPRLRQIVSVGSNGNNIARAIDWMKEHFSQPIHVKEMANHVGMSQSTFHHHFRTLTAMTPIQYQKRLRLNEARRLMLMENMDAANASYQVGYESPSQFSREYGRLFGSPPSRDIKRLRQLPARVSA